LKATRSELLPLVAVDGRTVSDRTLPQLISDTDWDALRDRPEGLRPNSRTRTSPGSCSLRPLDGTLARERNGDVWIARPSSLGATALPQSAIVSSPGWRATLFSSRRSRA
jgi:hypothetical protein